MQLQSLNTLYAHLASSQCHHYSEYLFVSHVSWKKWALHAGVLYTCFTDVS